MNRYFHLEILSIKSILRLQRKYGLLSTQVILRKKTLRN